MYFLGVDGGGTSTEALICDAVGNVIGRGLSGNGNYHVNRSGAKREITHAVFLACEQAKISVSEITYGCFGLAGADRKQDFINLRNLLTPIGIKDFEIRGDAYIGLNAALEDNYGIALICGTATNAVGINQKNKSTQIGGFGYSFGDYGGGLMLSRELFRHVLRIAQGRENFSIIADFVKEELNFRSLEELHNHYIDNMEQVPVHLSPLLFKAAMENDPFALRLIHKQAKELALSAKLINEKLFDSQDNTPIVLIGSLVTKKENNILLDYFKHEIKNYDMNPIIYPLKTSPVIGANLFALEKINNDKRSAKQVLETTYKEAVNTYEKN